jgi:3-hydroxyisobutyrate dehydrogenase-like beta-hydroxyacid dehydrogenase
VFDASGVDEVIFGQAGLAETMKPGTVILMHSTVAPVEVQELAARCDERGFRMLDAPVSGGQPKASLGSLTVMVGGDEAALVDAAGVLATFSDHVVHLGPVGAGSQAKLINNALFSAQIALADDAMIAGDSLGIDPVGLADILIRSSSSCVASGLRIRAGSMSGVIATQANLTLVKDVRLMSDVMQGAPGSELVVAAHRLVAKIDAAR